MDISKLHIFSKNTDAFASQRGYNYQTLKTLEIWVLNLYENIQEEIYCEYEEDIFQKNDLKEELKFRQIKLYSENFSFKSEEIRKCIAHFFMLHIKFEYSNFNKEFIFETNSEVARKHLNNEADLLREWAENEDVNQDELIEYSNKVKIIVEEYIREQRQKLSNDENESLINEAFEIFQKLEDPFWQDFTKLIKWKFLGISSDQEFNNTKIRVEELLYKLPYNIDISNIQQVFGVLLEKVFLKVSQEDSDKRKLTTDELELLILNIKGEEDRWYSKRFEYYNKIERIEEFRIGEFYEILDLVNYSRRKKYLLNHKDKWNSLLKFYTESDAINPAYRRKAIYELIFLNNEFHEVDFDNLKDRDLPKGELFGLEENIRYYFKDFTKFETAEELEKAKTLLNLLLPVIFNDNVNINPDEFKSWVVSLYKQVNKKLLSATDENQKCHLLEVKGNFLLGANMIRNKNRLEFLNYFEEILNHVENAPLYEVSRFNERIGKEIKTFISIDPSDKKGIIKSLEDFSEKLFPHVEKREGKSRLAKQQVERGYQYLLSSESVYLLKALEYFHKAKDNYLQEDTIKGYVLALLNIGQLYNSIGMHFAAKYYFLGAFRMSVNKEFINHVEKSLAGLFYSDFKQGSWFNAIEIYDSYIQLRDQSNIELSNYEDEGKITQRLAFILYSMKRISSQYTYFIIDYIKFLDYIGEDIVKPIFQLFDSDLDNNVKFTKAITNTLDDFPLNDVGNNRTISFYALGTLWEISFENTHHMSSISEEYISMIQIILAEISLSGFDFHLLKSKVDIELVLSDSYIQPEQLPSNESIKWRVFVCYFDNSKPSEINKHAAFNAVTLQYILNTASLLKQEEFEISFREFIKNRSLDSKQISVNLYQRIHRDLYTKEYFTFSQRNAFQKEVFELNLPSENKAMEWNNSLSRKYNKENAIEAIKNRFNNVHVNIYLTLEHLREDKDFPKFINDLREDGWKDWQIILTIFNFILNYKVNRFEKKEFTSEEEVVEHFNSMFKKYKALDEKDCYVEFPLDAFKTEGFNFQLQNSHSLILESYGLENKSITPNSTAIKEFLNIRFNLSVDNYTENNPIKDI